jgi:hypothetical protein
MLTIGGTHGLYATLTVLLSEPHAPFALKTTLLLPVDNGIVAETSPDVGLNCTLLTGTPFTVKLKPCAFVMFCTDAAKEMELVVAV